MSVLRAVGKHEEADVLDPESKPAPTISSNIPFARETAAAAAAQPKQEPSTQPAAPKTQAMEPQQATTEKQTKEDSAKLQQDQPETREQPKQPPQAKQAKQPKQPEEQQQQLQAKQASGLSTPVYLSILFALLVAVVAWVVA